MKQQDNGGAAFSLHPGISPEWAASAGMTLRDWFAGQALAGMMANCDDTGMSGWAHDPKYTAVKSYELADAMLEARK